VGRLGYGWGTALKPALEPICLARKPLSGTVAATVLAYGTGALNIAATRIGSDGGCAGAGADADARVFSNGLNGKRAEPVDGMGRWPANVIHDGSAEAVAVFPGEAGGGKPGKPGKPTVSAFGAGLGTSAVGHNDSGSAARFFYSAKADDADRLGSKHPTVKPVDLMAWLVRLITPPGGIVLDVFAGSGTTGMACLREGFDCILIEREAEYVADIRRRIAHVGGLDAPLFSGVSQPASQPASQPTGRRIYGAFADEQSARSA
jgi:site-specific DNA-methyltransferase (adenine-specific)